MAKPGRRVAEHAFAVGRLIAVVVVGVVVAAVVALH